ncbi:rhoptry protein ROP14, putative [Plasmodium vivax]|uniref:Rhoptry protein ROP14, putative n=1 Tax=Plasmodium vivax TaxID=5855 RepID=A0A564ZXJ5_PLAVI|nr:rhoptry protein ROP14, putative [Plasmodium vivax]
MDGPEMKGPARILVNDKEVNHEGGLRKVKNWLKGLAKNVLAQEDPEDAFPSNNKALRNTFWVSQLMCTRIILLCCFFSFVVAWRQNVALIGEDGLTPAKEHVEQVVQELRGEGVWAKFRSFHSLFWFLPASDLVLTALPVAGMLLSLAALLLNRINLLTVVPIYLALQSIYSVGNIWYGYAFELELLELVFLTLLLVPLCGNHLKSRYSTTPFVRYVWRFFIFKVLLGSSLIRFRNSHLWGHLEGRYYLYETQPFPSIVGYFLHGSQTMSKLDNLFCILTECVFSFFILFPVRSFRLIGGSLILLYCLLNFLTGNSYLFYVLLLAPLMFCFDDEVLLPFVLKGRRNEVLSVVREKAAQLARSRGYFRSFDIFFCTGLSVDEVNKMRDAYFRIDAGGGGGLFNGGSNTRGGSPQAEREHLLGRGTPSRETNFHAEEATPIGGIKTDVLNALHWAFSKKGPQYILENYNISRELIIHVLCTCIMTSYNSCVHIAYSTRGSILLFFVYLSCFLLYMVYLFFFTTSVVSRLASQLGLLLSVALIYTNGIFVSGFSDAYVSALFSLHLFFLLSLSLFYVKNDRFVVKFLCQYFYFILFASFFCFFVQNVLSPLQVMNEEYGSFQLMSVYGSFGSINQVRREIIIRGSRSTDGSSRTNSLETLPIVGTPPPGWDDYQFNCKPDSVQKPLCSQFRLLYGFLPVLYVDRLDLQFNQLSYSDDETILHTPWFRKFLKKLAANDEAVLSLLYRTPSFVTPSGGKNPAEFAPIHLTVSSDVYTFSTQGEKNAWWEVLSSRVILEQQGRLSPNRGANKIGKHPGGGRPGEHSTLLHVGGPTVIQHRNRAASRDASRDASRGGHYFSKEGDPSEGELEEAGAANEANGAGATGRESLRGKIRTQERNRYTQKKRKFFRQKKLQELRAEGGERDSEEEAQTMEGIANTGRGGEGEPYHQLEGAVDVAGGMATEAHDEETDGENLFSAAKKMEAAREGATGEEAQKREDKMGGGGIEKGSPNGVLPSVIPPNGVLPSVIPPNGALSLHGAIQKEMDEAIRNSYKQYGLLNDFSQKITKLGFVNRDQGRSRYGEIRQLLAGRRG